MLQRSIAALGAELRPHLDLGKSRAETMALLVTGMVSARTVNLSHVACERSGTVRIASTYRRLQRFFQHVDLGCDWAAPLVARMLALGGSWHLALDRTQWAIGAKEVNYLVLAIVTPHVRVPLIWSLIDGRGNSPSAVRIELMQRYLALFDRSTIRLLLADREFVGVEWIEFLAETGIPFAIRMREDIRMVSEAGHNLTLAAHLGRRKRTRFMRGRLSPGRADGLMLEFGLKRLNSGELLAVVSNRPARGALAAYRKRWAIESLFGDLKTRGLNLEDTRLKDPRKLDLLMGLAALAVAWIARAAIALIWPARPPIGSHGYLAKSWFRTGFDHLRQSLRTDPMAAVTPWRNLRRKPLKTPRVV